MKKSWKIMKSVIGNKRKTNQNIKRFKMDNSIIDNELRIANKFNSYFVYVGPTLAAHQIITYLNPLHYIQINPNSIVMLQIEYIDVVNVIYSLKNSNFGWDGIPYRLAKIILNLYINHLPFSLINLFMKGFFQMN